MDYHYSQAVVWDGLGGFVRTARSVRSTSVVDPATGLPPTLTQDGVTVTYLTADADGLATFIATCDTVLLDFGAGPVPAYSTEKLASAGSGAPTTIDGGTP